MRTSALNKKIVICAFALTAIIAGCVKNTSVPPLTPSTSTIAAIVKGGSNVTIFDSALSKSGLDSLLDLSGPFTLFLPTDAACLSAGFTDSSVYKMTRDSLRKFLAYYIIQGQALKLAGGGLPTGPNAPLEMLNQPDTIYCTVFNGAGYINGKAISQSDVIAKNGVIQVLSGLYYPPQGNILTVIQNDSTLSFLDTAIMVAKNSAAYGNIFNLLASGAYTLFAPTNSAFRSTADSTSAIIFAGNPDTVARLLQTHIVAGRIFSSGLSLTDTLYSVYSPNPDSLFVSSQFGLTIKSKGDSTAASIITTNIQATNGVIHKINQVLFP
ncbi:MAG: fasciclin domain-containing protein [Bacteroidetes bacterium]|nr:fasciclin domain-containing protein [Bacteroidota bacterium]MBS1972784.1 fasciclin domain-containing protein [Bacteroidota bacterium]